MKKTLLSLSILFSVGVSAQLTQSNHAPAVGDKIYETFECDTLNINAGPGGPGAIWTYPTNNLLNLKTYNTATSTDISFNPANVSVSSSASNSSYYSSNSNNLKYYGGVMSINGTVITIKYATPAVYASYPMSLNTTTTTATSGSVSALGQSGTFTGNCTVNADATGTLVLPAKTFTNVIRLHTLQTLTVSLSGGLVSATVTLNNYDYYQTNASKAPIFSIATSTLLSSVASPSSQKLTTVMKDYNIVGVNEAQKSSIELSVYPNPASSIINFATESMAAAKVIAFDVTGQIVAIETMEIGKAKINLNTLSAGVYMYQVLDKNSQVLKVGKFNVAK